MQESSPRYLRYLLNMEIKVHNLVKRDSKLLHNQGNNIQSLVRHHGLPEL